MTSLNQLLGGSFVASKVPEDERGDFELLPNGDYTVVVTESDVAATKNGGQMLKLTPEIVDGKFKGRKLWNNLNIVNASEDAQRIAHQTLAKLVKAIGKDTVNDTNELHGIRVLAKVKTEPAKGEYPARNKIVAYKAMGASANSGTTTPTQASDAGASPAKRPWQS